MAAVAPPSLWVTKWVDYSSKYGVGYQLAGGHVGVLFNDMSSLVFLPGGQYAHTSTPTPTHMRTRGPARSDSHAVVQ
jgi:hypothetical protein